MASLEWFVGRVHYLLQAGYETMTPQELGHFNRRSEPDITAGLAMRIQQLIDDRKLTGITKLWSVVDNWPENQLHLPLTKQPAAKKRKLPDLKFRFGGRRESLYFRFEAKKLAGSGDYADLIGYQDGLGRFLRRAYGRQDMAGGLIGYVHTESPIVHADRVKLALAANPRRYRVSADGAWAASNWKSGPECCFRVIHSRERATAIAIFYSFLLFRG
jgi:hypothetical protein